MDLGDLSLFQGLQGRLRWVAQNHSVIAENIANADTPDYRARSIAPFDFRRTLEGQRLKMQATQSGHISTGGKAGEQAVREDRHGYETTISGNSVILEEQMIAASENAMQHQMAINLYQKHVGMLRMVLRDSTAA